MQNGSNLKEENSSEKVLTQGKVIKVVEELEFGVLETEDSDFLFFHISSFDGDINISDIKEGDLVLCNKEVQPSDGKKAAINCQRVEFEGYLKDYFIDNALVAPGDVEKFDEFCENAREYAGYLVEAGIGINQIEDLKNDVMEAETVMDLKNLRPKIENRIVKYKDNKTFVELLEILDEIIKKISLDREDKMEIDNFKSFIHILLSYIQFL